MMILGLICIEGCSYKDVKQTDPFRSLYPGIFTSPSNSSSLGGRGTGALLTISCLKMPFSVLSRILSDKFLIGIVFSEKLADKFITAEFKDTDLESVLNVISRQLDVRLVKVGNTYFIGDLRPEDRGILVRRVLGFDKSELKDLLSSSVSEKGKVSVSNLGVVVAVDADSVIRRISETLEYLSSVDQPTWILQLVFVIIRHDELLEGGLKTTTSGSISYNVSENKFILDDLSIDGVVNALSSSSYADLHAAPMLLIKEGQKSFWKNGERIPIPRKTVSSYGTTQVSGYDYVETGFNVTASVISSAGGKGYLTMNIEKSQVSGYVEEAPIKEQNVYEVHLDMYPLQPYLLGELHLYKETAKQDNILNFGKDNGKSVLQVWGQLYRINGASIDLYDKSRTWNSYRTIKSSHNKKNNISKGGSNGKK